MTLWRETIFDLAARVIKGLRTSGNTRELWLYIKELKYIHVVLAQVVPGSVYHFLSFLFMWLQYSPKDPMHIKKGVYGPREILRTVIIYKGVTVYSCSFSPGCPRPSIALQVQNCRLKQQSLIISIHVITLYTKRSNASLAILEYRYISSKFHLIGLG